MPSLVRPRDPGHGSPHTPGRARAPASLPRSQSSGRGLLGWNCSLAVPLRVSWWRAVSLPAARMPISGKTAETQPCRSALLGSSGPSCSSHPDRKGSRAPRGGSTTREARGWRGDGLGVGGLCRLPGRGPWAPLPGRHSRLAGPRHSQRLCDKPGQLILPLLAPDTPLVK